MKWQRNNNTNATNTPFFLNKAYRQAVNVQLVTTLRQNPSQTALCLSTPTQFYTKHFSSAYSGGALQTKGCGSGALNRNSVNPVTFTTFQL